jgi:eukaryotic-like serine/threonine-protein kinase
MTVGTPSDLRQGGRLSQSRNGMDDAVRRLGRFQIIGRLATGGMAEVYLALSGELPGFRTLIVVKRILPHLASNRQFIRMFLDEARLAALLDHPNVVRIIEVGHDGEEYFLAMELVQGKPLSAVLRKATRERRPPTPALAAYLIAQAASGLGYAHGLTDGEGQPLGVVHRDVSPQNVLISFEGAVKLIDFGVARAFGRVAHTSPGGLKGKIEYMSPEQASAEEVDHRADVFALGVVLWEVLTGKRLFRRETELATMRAIVDDPIPRPSEVADVPPELEAVVMRALRKRRDARYGSAHEMALALERYAFSNDGFSPQQVATYMKGLFAPEFLQWRKTATAALDMEVEPVAQGKARMDALGAEPVTQGPTMALRPGLSSSGLRLGAEAQTGTQSRGSQSRDRESQSRGSRSQASRSQTGSSASVASSPSSASVASSPSLVGPPSKRDRVWVYGGLAILATITAAGTWMLTRPPTSAGSEPDRPPALVVPASAPAATPAESARSEPPAGETAAPLPKAGAPAPAAPGASAPGATPSAATPPLAAPSAATPPLAAPAALVPAPAAQPAKPASHPRPRRRSRSRHDEASSTAAVPAAPTESDDDSKKADPFE